MLAPKTIIFRILCAAGLLLLLYCAGARAGSWLEPWRAFGGHERFGAYVESNRN